VLPLIVSMHIPRRSLLLKLPFFAFSRQRLGHFDVDRLSVEYEAFELSECSLSRLSGFKLNEAVIGSPCPRPSDHQAPRHRAERNKQIPDFLV